MKLPKMKLKQLFSPYVVYTPKERFEIAKYVVEIGTSKASRYKSRFPSLKESTVRRFKSK